MQSVGKIIQRERKLRGWSADLLAAKTERIVSVSTVRRIEEDDPTVGAAKIKVLCDLLGLQFDMDHRRLLNVSEPTLSDVLADLDRLADQAAGMIKNGTAIPEELRKGFDRLAKSLGALAGTQDRIRMKFGDKIIPADQIEKRSRGAASTDPQTARLEREKKKRQGK